MLFALISLNQSWEDKEANKIKCLQFIIRASQQKCDAIIFPEMTLTGFSMNTDFIKENIKNSDTIKWFVENAIKYEINIIFGVVLENEDLATNNAIVVSKTGEILCNYAKIHPFSFANEDSFYKGGNELGTFNIDGINFGITICYDLRFPELYQALSKTSSIIINIANWLAKRIEHWNALSVARAIENQVYMLMVNRVGQDGKENLYIKSTKIIDPNGIVWLVAQNDTEMDVYELDVNVVNTIRDAFPVKKDRKVDLYKKIL